MDGFHGLLAYYWLRLGSKIQEDRLHKGFPSTQHDELFKFQEFCETKGDTCFQVLFCFCKIFKNLQHEVQDIMSWEWCDELYTYKI